MTDELDELDLHAFLDGQLDPRQEAAVLARMENDPGLRERMRAYAEQDLALKAAQAEGLLQRQPLPGLVAGLSGRLRRQIQRERLVRIAAAVMLFVMGWGARDVSDYVMEPDLPDYARDALENHEVFAERQVPPVEIAGNRQEELHRMLVAQLGSEVKVPELRAIGLRLIGARRTGTDDGPGSQLIYEDGSGHRVTLTVASSDDQPDADRLEMTEADGYVVGYWRGQHFGYALIGREPAQNLIQVAAAIGAPMAE